MALNIISLTKLNLIQSFVLSPSPAPTWSQVQRQSDCEDQGYGPDQGHSQGQGRCKGQGQCNGQNQSLDQGQGHC